MRENHEKWVGVTKQPPQLFKKAGFKNFAIFTGKHLRWSLPLIKLQAFRSATLLKSGSNTGLPVNIANVLKKICKHLFWRRSANGFFWTLVGQTISLKTFLNVYLGAILLKFLSTPFAWKTATFNHFHCLIHFNDTHLIFCSISY